MKNKSKNIAMQIMVAFCYVLSFSIICVCKFMILVFDVGVDSIIFTLANPVKGANTDIVFEGVKYCVPRIIVFIVVYVLVSFIICRKKNHLYLNLESNKTKKTWTIDCTKLGKKVLAWLSIITLVFSVFYVNKNYDFVGYMISKNTNSRLYEDYYINPNNVEFVLNNEEGKKKNLIHIVMESMENTYSTAENGGIQSTSIIKNLDKLAKENINFSATNNVGGFYTLNGTTWTSSALLALTSGVNYKFPIIPEDMKNRTEFAENVVSIGNILDSFGYNQMFLCGSDGDYAGRKSYFQSHGNYEVYDYYSAIEDGYIDEDYYVWWGFEDEYLYEIAKDQLTDLNSKNEPFNLTMLTVDTHFYEGYECGLCDKTIKDKTTRVVDCADRQIKNFIDWCKEQEFFEDTVIVITGDHLRMDRMLVEGAESRTCYNVFINSQINDKTYTKNRIFTSLDMFPTIVASLGFEWGIDRLGLGTNLFSGKQTIAEELGLEKFEEELSKRSQFYIDNFY